MAEDQADQRRQDGQRRGADDDHRRIVSREAGNEVLGTRFPGGGVFHQIQYFADRAFTENLCGPDAQHAAHVDAAADDLVTGLYALTGQGAGVQAGFPVFHDAVNRDFLPGFHRNDAAGFHFVRIHPDQLSVLLQIGIIRSDIHQFGNVPPAFAHGIALEQFADLVKQHYGDGLVIIAGFQQADDQGPNGGDGHEEVFVEHLAVQDPFEGFPQDIMSDDEVGHQVQQHAQETLQQAAFLHSGKPREIFRKEMQDCQENRRRTDANQHFFLFLGHGMPPTDPEGSGFFQDDRGKEPQR